MKRTTTVKISAPAALAPASAPTQRSRRTDAVVLGEARNSESEMSSPPISGIPNAEIVEGDDDLVIDVPLVVHDRENSRSPFQRDNVGTRSSSRDARATMEQLRSALASASSPSGRAGISDSHGHDSDSSHSSLEEDTVPLLEPMRPSTPSSARKAREDSGRPTTLTTSVVMAPHSVSTSAITYTRAASSSSGRPKLVLPTTTGPARSIDRPDSPMHTSSSEEREMRAAWEDEGYRAFRSHQLWQQRAAAADGRSEFHPMYRQENAGTNFHTNDRRYMGNMNGLPLNSRLVSDEALRTGFERGYLNPSDQRFPFQRASHMGDYLSNDPYADVGPRGSTVRKLADLSEEDLIEECRRHNERPAKSSRSALSSHGPSSIPHNDPRYGPSRPDATIPMVHPSSSSSSGMLRAPPLPPASDPRRPRKGSKAELQLQLDQARVEMEAYRRLALGPLGSVSMRGPPSASYGPPAGMYEDDQVIHPVPRRNVPAVSTIEEMARENPPRHPARRSHSFQGTSPPLPRDMMYDDDDLPPLELVPRHRPISRRNISNPTMLGSGGHPSERRGDDDDPDDPGDSESDSDIISDDDEMRGPQGPRTMSSRRPWAHLPNDDHVSESSASVASSGRSRMSRLKLSDSDTTRAGLWALVHSQLMDGGDPEAPLDLVSVVQAVEAGERMYVTVNGAWYRKIIQSKKKQNLHGMPWLPVPVMPSPLHGNAAKRANCMPNNYLMFEQNFREDQAALLDNARRILTVTPTDVFARRLNDMIVDETNLCYEMLIERLDLLNLRPTPGSLTLSNPHHISGWMVFIVWWHSRLTRWLYACYHAPRSEDTDLATIVKSLTKSLPESFTTHVSNVLARPPVELYLIFGLRYLGYKCCVCREPGSPWVICVNSKCHPASAASATPAAVQAWNADRTASVNASIVALKAAKKSFVRADLEREYAAAHPKPVMGGPRPIAYLLTHQDLVPIEPAVVLRLAHHTA